MEVDCLENIWHYGNLSYMLCKNYSDAPNNVIICRLTKDTKLLQFILLIR